jgi:hypothetical protein
MTHDAERQNAATLWADFIAAHLDRCECMSNTEPPAEAEHDCREPECARPLLGPSIPKNR